MRAFVFAYSEMGATGIRALLDLGVEVVGVLTHVDNPLEEKWFRSVRQMAESKQIPVRAPEDVNAPDMLAWGTSLKPDVIFSFYIRQMLQKPWLELAPLGAYNLHGSLLPKFRGRACVNWTLIEGATETGMTLHEMTPRADAGCILGQERVEIDENDNISQLYVKLVPAAQRLLHRVVPQIRDGKAEHRLQDHSKATQFGGRKPEDGLIDWQWPAKRIHNWVRALTRPYPGAFTFLDGRKLLVLKGRVLTGKSAGVPGQVLKARADGVPVATGDGLFLVQDVQTDNASVKPAQAVLPQPDIVLTREPIDCKRCV